MDTTDTTDGLSRRSVLLTASTAALAAGVGTGATPALADEAGYGAPLVDLVVPAGVLTREQKGALIKGITDVLVKVANLPTGTGASPIFVQIFETAEDGFGVNGAIFVPRAKRPG